LVSTRAVRRAAAQRKMAQRRLRLVVPVLLLAWLPAAPAKQVKAKLKLASKAKPKRNASSTSLLNANKSIGYVALDSYMKEQVQFAISKRHTDRVILPLFSNLGFMPYLKNLLCSILRVHVGRCHFAHCSPADPALRTPWAQLRWCARQVENYAVVSMDNLTCAALRSTGFVQPPEACVSPYALRPLSDSSDQGAYSAYNSLHFWRLVVQRPLWIMWMLREGYSVLQCDVDIVFLHNPFPALEAPKMRRFDALFQSEQVYGINCGFYFVRPTNATRQFMQSWLDDMVGPRAHHVVKGGKMHEQHSFVRKASEAKRHIPGFASRKLNESEFPNGKIWYNYWHWTSKQTAYVMHCNWIKMNKKSRLRRDNLWFLEEDDSVCASRSATALATAPSA